MREAGFEPANPKDVGLSDVALTTNRFARNITFFILFYFCWKGVPLPSIYLQTSLSCLRRASFFSIHTIHPANLRERDHDLLRSNRSIRHIIPAVRSVLVGVVISTVNIKVGWRKDFSDKCVLNNVFPIIIHTIATDLLASVFVVFHGLLDPYILDEAKDIHLVIWTDVASSSNDKLIHSCLDRII